MNSRYGQYPRILRPTSTSSTQKSTCTASYRSNSWRRCSKSEPIRWVDVPGGTGGFGDKGYWLVTKHADVKEVSKRNDIFGSSPDGAIPVWPQGHGARARSTCSSASCCNMDAPQHTRLRKIISRGFTPRAGRPAGGGARGLRAQKIAETAAAGGSGDFVEQVLLASCRSRPSPVCWACRRTTATSSSAGQMR